MTDDNGMIVKTVAYVANSALNRVMGKVEDVSWFQQLALEWFSEEGIYTSLPTLRVKELQVSAAKQVKLPSDCLRYTKIAIDLGGKLWTLTMDTSITLPPAYDCNNTPENTDENSGNGIWFAANYWNGAYNGGVFALGGGFNDAYYRFDESTRTISFLDNRIGRRVVIEYLSNNNDANSNSLVPQLWISPLRNWLIMKAAQYRPKDFPQINYNLAFEDYSTSLTNANVASGPTIDEILDAYFNAPGLTVR
jgi:hypothetical protein